MIRASALRVLSSIRVQMIVPIMMLAIKDSVMDMSPYVRKTAAHAIPKLYRYSITVWVHFFKMRNDEELEFEIINAIVIAMFQIGNCGGVCL